MTNWDKNRKTWKNKDTDDYTVEFDLTTLPVYERFVWWNPISWGRWLFQRSRRQWTHLSFVKQKRSLSLFVNGEVVMDHDMDKGPINMNKFLK